jgi:hypothetical protein
MKKSFFKIFTLFLLTVIFSFASIKTNAQCPMCKMSAEQNLKDGGTVGKGLNAGILYMFAAPYLLVGSLGFIWWYNRRKEDEIEFEDSET